VQARASKEISDALFAISLFFAPPVAAIPSMAYGPALIIVGSMMVPRIARINFDDPGELLPAFVIIALMSFTYNIGVGITAGLALYPLFKLLQGPRRRGERWPVAAGRLIAAVFSVLSEALRCRRGPGRAPEGLSRAGERPRFLRRTG
jgi:AGZA family xanthine/uracil permease-like MFS transporter